MSAIRIFHLSGNVYPELPVRHHSLRIWEELSKGADEYHVLASSGAIRYSHTTLGNIHLHLLPTVGPRMWGYFLSSWLIVLFGIRYRPTKIIAQCAVVGGLAGAVLSAMFRIPMLTEIHGAHYFFPTRSGLFAKIESAGYRLLSRPAFKISARIRSLSEDMTAWIRKTYGEAAAEKVVLIPNRVDLKTFSPPKQTYEVDEPVKVISVGAYSPTKNHLKLIEELFAACPGARLTLVGRGQLSEDYLKLARRLGVGDQVQLFWATSHEEVAARLADSDVYIHYSIAEGVPRAVLEAMAMGLPIICTPVGFIQGVLCHDQDVLLLGSPGAEDLSVALDRLRASALERARLGRAARTTIVDRFEWDRAFAIYRREIADCDSPRPHGTRRV